jgi:outer membrane protein assembly factor BamB
LVYMGSADGILYALDAATGEERWRFATDVVFTSSPAVSQETVFAASGQSLYALDAGTGIERWRFETSDVLASSPAIAGGLVYIGSWDGAVYAMGSSDGNQ